MEPVKERRVCILGTAPTWRDAPFNDPSIEMWGLNDAHVLKLPRADRWYDLHPVDKMFFYNGSKKILSHQVPAGYFLRPQGHLEFLKAQSIPVYVQDAAQLGTPNARTFPKAEVEAAVGPYFASSPAWMVGHALMEGVTELHLYGIHLATEWEYLKQKPNMTFLLGLAAGRGVKIVIPKTAPLLRESHQYAYDLDPDLPKVAIKRRMDGLKMELQAVEQKMAVRRWWQRVDPNWATRHAWLQAQLMDCQLELHAVNANRSPIGA